MIMSYFPKVEITYREADMLFGISGEYCDIKEYNTR